jgi:tetratricopeptide (TPR) repeat protein
MDKETRGMIDELFRQAKGEWYWARTGITIQCLEEILEIGEADEEFMRTETYQLTHRYLGMLYHDHDQHWKAVKHIRKAIELGTLETSDLYDKLGKSLFGNDNYEEAVVALEKALEIDPSNEDARFWLAWSHGKLIASANTTSEKIKRLRFAQKHCAVVRQTAPEDAHFLENLIAQNI